MLEIRRYEYSRFEQKVWMGRPIMMVNSETASHFSCRSVPSKFQCSIQLGNCQARQLLLIT